MILINILGEPQCIQGTALTDTNGNFVVCGGTTSSVSLSCPGNYFCYFDGTTYGCCPTQGWFFFDCLIIRF